MKGLPEAKPIHEKPLKPIPLISEIPTRPLVVTPACAVNQVPVRLETGDPIEPDSGTDGDSKLEIRNGGSVDAAVRLVDLSTNETSRFVYIRAHDTSTLDGIEPGTYSVRYSSGLDWIPNCVDFVRGEAYDEFEQPFEFRTTTEETEDGTLTRVNVFEISLNPVLGGTARTRKIDKKRFLEGDRRFVTQP